MKELPFLDQDARMLLESAREDRPDPGALERELERVGLGASAATIAAGGDPQSGPGHAAGGDIAEATRDIAANGWSSLAGSTTAKLVLFAGTIALTGALSIRQFSGSGAGPRMSEASGPAVSIAVPVASIVRSPDVAAPPAPVLAAADLPDAPRSPHHALTSRPPAAPATHRAPPAPASTGSARTLAEELAMLDRARALVRSAPDAAMSVLDDHGRKYPATPFAEESALLRVEALVAAGRRSEAERVAEPFVRDRAGAPVARRMKDLLEGARPGSAR